MSKETLIQVYLEEVGLVNTGILLSEVAKVGVLVRTIPMLRYCFQGRIQISF